MGGLCIAELVPDTVEALHLGLQTDQGQPLHHTECSIARALRQITASLGGVSNGFPRETGFDITVASEVMAILCLAKDLADLETRLGVLGCSQTLRTAGSGLPRWSKTAGLQSPHACVGCLW